MSKSTEIKNTKKNLRIMSRNGNSHHLRSSRRIIKYGTISFGRNIWLSIAAILITTMTLLVLIVTFATMHVLNYTSEQMREKIDVTVYFKPQTPAETLEQMADTLRADSNVRSVEISTSDQVAEQIFSENSEDENVSSVLEDETVRSFIQSTAQSLLRIKVYNTENIDSIKQIIDTDETIQANLFTEKELSYDANKIQIDNINSWARIAQYGGIAASAIFLIISILVIFNTIRMAIFSRREEIYMMKLVGASKNFIRGPFLVEAQICGIISGILASGLGYLIAVKLSPSLSENSIDMTSLNEILNSSQIVIVFAAVIGLGLLISTISASLAIKKYLKKA